MRKQVPDGVLDQLALALEFGRVDPAGASIIIEDAAGAIPGKEKDKKVKELLLTVSKKRRGK